MRKPGSVRALEELGRVRLSPSFFMRDFLHSEVANFYGLFNIPDDPDLAIASGRQLCEALLEPLRERFGRISIRSAYRCRELARICNERRHNCARAETEYANHIWDRRDAEGRMGAMATIVVHAFIPYYREGSHREALAWWVHDCLPYSAMQFFPKTRRSTSAGASAPRVRSTATSRRGGAG